MSLRLKIVLAVLAVTAGFLVVRAGSLLNQKARRAQLNLNTTSATSLVEQEIAADNPLTRDSDRDGISDRDEIIFGTDLFNKDTDGDGFTDGEEIISNHDPLDSSANDKLGSSGISFLSPTANLTDRLLNMGLASIINDYGNLDPAEMTNKKFADIFTSLNSEAALYFTFPSLNDSDIEINQDNSPATIKKYLNTVTPIIEEGVFSSNSGVPRQEADYYENVYRSLKAIPVPSSWKELHKQALHDFLGLASAFESLTDEAIEQDPVKASFALSFVQESFINLNGLLNQAARLAKSQNISLDNSIIDLLQSSNNSPLFNQ